jgi:hypothetical protein
MFREGRLETQGHDPYLARQAGIKASESTILGRFWAHRASEYWSVCEVMNRFSSLRA